MDYELILLIPLDQISKLSLTEIMAFWGGQVFSRAPREFRFGDSLHFIESLDRRHFQKYLNGCLDLDGWIALYLKDNPLAQISYQVNTGAFRPQTCPLVLLIHQLYASLDAFCLMEFLYEEQIHHTYTPADADEAIRHLLDSLDWENPSGIILLKHA